MKSFRQYFLLGENTRLPEPDLYAPKEVALIKRLDSSPHVVDLSVYQRFDERNTAFLRAGGDPEAPFYKTFVYDNSAEVIAKDVPGYSRTDFARIAASWTIYKELQGSWSEFTTFPWRPLGGPNPVSEALGRYSVEDPAQMTQEVKDTAMLFGADVVGISQLDRRWLYSHDPHGEFVQIPEHYTIAIVMAMEMEPIAVGQSPAFPSAVATGIGYSRMAFAISCLAQFIRTLGFDAIPMGNDTALSIPLAIDAGLGSLGRNGLLITPEYGSCVRLCKVFTDLPLEPDRPIDFGVTEVCARCGNCTSACPVGAVSSDPTPSFQVVSTSNNPGIKRWVVDPEKCYSFWVENGACCSNCIAACSYTPRRQERTTL